MNKSLVGLMIVATGAAAVCAPSHAAAVPLPGEVIIGGRVTNHGFALAGYPVAISCKGKLWANSVAGVRTTSLGYYGTRTTTKLCPLGSMAEVRTDIDGDGKFEISAEDVVRPNTTVNIFVERGNTVVPEFGWMAGVVAAGTAYGVAMLVRKRAAGDMGEG